MPNLSDKSAHIIKVRKNTHRIAARPKLLLSVCVTHRFEYLSTRATALVLVGAKSIYASSTITIPLNFEYSNSSWMSGSGIRVPVGFPGEQRKMSLIDGSASTFFFIYRKCFGEGYCSVHARALTSSIRN